MNQDSNQQGKALLAKKLFNIFSLFSVNKKIDFVENEEVTIPLSNSSVLFEITPSEISIPSVTIPASFYNKPSPLADNFVSEVDFKNFIKNLTDNDLITRLNHIGLCYLVDSKQEERKRLKSEIMNTKWHLFEEESKDSSDWFFLGDNNNWQDPLIEFVPTEMTNDEWRDYWLPHFQIDIDTNLSGEEIEQLVNSIFKGKVYPYRLLVVNGYICIIRARLGSVSGINIELDLGTAGRGTQYHREKLLKQII